LLRSTTRYQTFSFRPSLESNAQGLKYVALTHPSGAKSEVYLLGGVPTQYSDSDGTEWIAVRPDAKLDGSKPISGGLSHCFPQFGPGAIQQHGFARNVDWEVVTMGDSSVTLKLAPSEYTKAIWDKDFECHFTTTLTGESLDTELVVKNTGREAFDFQAALHRCALRNSLLGEDIRTKGTKDRDVHYSLCLVLTFSGNRRSFRQLL
jgi:glucose-6-phosphate 1-epimerase